LTTLLTEIIVGHSLVHISPEYRSFANIMRDVRQGFRPGSLEQAYFARTTSAADDLERRFDIALGKDGEWREMLKNMSLYKNDYGSSTTSERRTALKSAKTLAEQFRQVGTGKA